MNSTAKQNICVDTKTLIYIYIYIYIYIKLVETKITNNKTEVYLFCFNTY